MSGLHNLGEIVIYGLQRFVDASFTLVSDRVAEQVKRADIVFFHMIAGAGLKAGE
jgi:hypothetical protein